jgi:hypothetical protein
MPDSQWAERARDFMQINARLLERQLYRFLFEGGSRDEALAALAAYQNPDGGFGHGLESDLRTPFSQPLAVEKAFEMLTLLGAMDHPMVLKACDFLEGISTPEGGVPFVLPTSRGYPHTPWMEGSDHPAADLNPTASLAGMLLAGGVNHPWRKRASAFCRAKIPTTQSNQFHDVMPVVSFLQHCGDPTWAQPQLERLLNRVRQPGAVEMDPDAGGYVKKPLDWAPEPGAFFRPIFSAETIALHLHALAARQQPDGGWPINWPALGPGAELEWRGWVTLQAVRALEAYK